MTENEAIEELKYDCNELGKAIPCDTSWGCSFENADGMAIQALEKQIPKKDTDIKYCEQLSKCGNNDCQWHKYCEGGLMWYDEDITECRYWIKPKPTKMKNIKVAEADYDKAVKVLKRNKIEFK